MSSGRHHLPWQNTRDPYRVWLSEVMLQQTQVSTVVPYFTKFVERLPTVASLASAPSDEVLGLWSGLGYYSRARNMHQCARDVVEKHAGVFPSSAHALEKLPGIGRSTAAAIAALCFGERVAILDANVKRVLTRILGFDADISRQTNERQLWAAAAGLLPTSDPDASMPRYTQGMMDLGATICLPRKPLCGACPLADVCSAHRMGNAEHFPVKNRKLKRSSQSVWLLWALARDGAIWLQRRPVPGVWAGLYCLPWFDSRDELLAVLPGEFRSMVEDLNAVKHVLTHKDMHLHPMKVLLPHAAMRDGAGRWVAAGEWPSLGLPAPVRQMLLQA